MPMLTRMRKPASASAARFCAFPWPYGCPRSAGRTATETAKNVSSAAARSVPECAASASRPRLELAIPATSLIATRRHAAPTETSAVRRCGDMRRRLEPPSVASERVLSSAGEGLPALRARERGRRALLLGLRDAARGGSAGTRGAQSRHVPLLRPRRLHCPRGDAWTPRTYDDSSSPTTRWCAPSSSVSEAPSRSSSATPSWRSSVRRSPTRTIRSERCALRSRSARRSPRTASSRSGSASRPARPSSPSTPVPEAGEGIGSGDVVNTAARIQAAAPTREGFLVDETTMRATERAIEYAEASSIDAKGKSQPVAVWQATRARARVGVERLGGAQLVGRERELVAPARARGPVSRRSASRSSSRSWACRASARAGSSSSSSRRSEPENTGSSTGDTADRCRTERASRSGRSARWSRRRPASSSPIRSTQTAAKLRRAVESVLSDPSEAGWVERHLRPLAGLDADETGGSGDASEAFAAWRRFLEANAYERRLVLVFEDLHWADDVMLDFVDYLVDRSRSVPLLALCTARPELLTRRPGWGGGKVNSSTILLTPLSEDETSSLVSALLGDAAIETGVRERLLERAGGNPLYAEEFARMLVERPAETVVPETVQGLIAARIDTLPPRGEGSPPGGRGRRACLLARRSRRASVGRSRSGCTPSSARSSYDASSDAPSPEKTSTSSGMRSSATSPTSRSLDPSVLRCIAQWPNGSSPSAGPTTTPRRSYTTTRLLSTSPGRRVRT